MKAGLINSPSSIQIANLKLVVNASVNKLDIFSKSGGAVPDATHPIYVAIPDGNGITLRSRAGSVASGTGQIIMADAANYWSKGSLDGEIKTAYVYAIQSTADNGVVLAACGYSGFTRVPASTTATDDDFMLLEASSTYTPVVTDYCAVIGKFRYQYDTADTPDHTIQATVLDAPQVIWNPKSDYGYQKNLAAQNTSEADITEYSAISIVVKQSGKYSISLNIQGYATTTSSSLAAFIKTGSATYGSAVQKGRGLSVSLGANCHQHVTLASVLVSLNAGDTVHGGASVTGAGSRAIYGDDVSVGMTYLSFKRAD